MSRYLTYIIPFLTLSLVFSCSTENTVEEETANTAEMTVQFFQHKDEIYMKDCAGSGNYQVSMEHLNAVGVKQIRTSTGNNESFYVQVQLTGSNNSLQSYNPLAKIMAIESTENSNDCNSNLDIDSKLVQCLSKILEPQLEKSDSSALKQFISENFLISNDLISGNSHQMARSIIAQMKLTNLKLQLIDLWQSPEGVVFSFIHSNGFWEAASSGSADLASPKMIRRYLHVKSQEKENFLYCSEAEYPSNSMIHGNWFLSRIDTSATGKVEFASNFMSIDIIEGRAQGNSGCNRFGFSVRVLGDSIVPVGIAMTQRYCPQIAKFEDQYFSSLSAIKSFKLNDGYLVGTGNEKELMRFRGPSNLNLND